MDYKEKYEKALERANQLLIDGCSNYDKETIWNIFPEIMEDKDERIRKELIDNFKWFCGDYPETTKWGKDDNLLVKDIIAWLEKQGEQKPVNKVEPKFKVGDWIVEPRDDERDYFWHITTIDDENYWNGICGVRIKHADEKYHLWTIADAKDGDVLYINNTMSESIMIYKSSKNGIIKKYASYDKFGFEGEHYFTLNDGYIIPATKEQRDLLFQKMKEAGYEWDAEKKELRKIDDYCKEHCKGFQETGKCFADGECKAKRDAEQNSAWSEEDEDAIGMAIKALEDLCDVDDPAASFIGHNLTFDEAVQRLKCLKSQPQPQPHWKPTEEQIEGV